MGITVSNSRNISRTNNKPRNTNISRTNNKPRTTMASNKPTTTTTSNLSRTTSNITRIDVSKSSKVGEDQSVVYSTPHSRTCTLCAIVGEETASVTMRDYTFDNKGTIVNIKVRKEEDHMGAVEFEYSGNAIEVRKENNGAMFVISYGVAQVRVGALQIVRYHTENIPGSCGTAFGGRFMSEFIGPEHFPSTKEAAVATIITGKESIVGNHTTITGLINNTGGPVYGNLNGSIINFFRYGEEQEAKKQLESDLASGSLFSLEDKK